MITATTIESAVYNGFVNDVETDLNTPRPVVAGGTGATNATQARDNLEAEVAGGAGHQLRQPRVGNRVVLFVGRRDR